MSITNYVKNDDRQQGSDYLADKDAPQIALDPVDGHQKKDK